MAIFQTIYRGIEIVCEAGDITQAQYGAIVVSSDSSFSLNAGAGNAVLRAGGPSFQQNLAQAKAQMNGNVNILAVQAAGGLKCNSVLLVALRGHQRNYMQSLYNELIQEAIRLNVGSVAIPAIGCGAYGYQLDAAAEHARDAIQNCTNFGTLTKICFMDLTGYSLHEFRDKLSILIPQGNLPQIQMGLLPGMNPNSSSNAIYHSRFPRMLPNASVQNMGSGFMAQPTTSNSSNGPSPPKKKKTAKSKSSFKTKESKEMVVPYRIINRSDLPKPSEADRAQNGDDPYHSCSICLSDMESISESQGDHEEDIVELKKCSHIFHKSCIDAAFKCKAQCPNCLTWYAPAMGNQPKGSKMQVNVVQNGWNLGFQDAQGHIVISYSIPGGVQTEEHPRPGVHFTGTHRTGYLPNNPEGNEVLRLLQLAFERRLIFTVGDSVTSGQQNTVVWNNIHHKTSMSGGAQMYGYPDETYLTRVKEELSAVGIRVEMLEEDE